MSVFGGSCGKVVGLALLVALTWMCAEAGAQLELVWNKTYGGPAYDSARGLVKSGDGGFVVAGSTESFGEGGMSTSTRMGTRSGKKTYGGNNDEETLGIVPRRRWVQDSWELGVVWHGRFGCVPLEGHRATGRARRGVHLLCVCIPLASVDRGTHPFPPR